MSESIKIQTKNGYGTTLAAVINFPPEFDAAKALVEQQRAFLQRAGRPLPKEIRYGVMLEVPALAEMRVLQRGNRLSITPVTASEWRVIQRLLDA